ncbi:glucose-6-phosphate dehydrogenase [Gemmatimonadota bacterium]
MTDLNPIEPHLFVIHGGSGDLARRKLFPALYQLLTEEGKKGACHVLGVGRKDLGDDGFREIARESFIEAGVPADIAGPWCADCIHYQQMADIEKEGPALAQRIREIEETYSLPGNRVFYLALPPRAFPGTIRSIGGEGLNHGPGWVRLVVEKPFGTDLESARALNRLIHEYFDESQVYRIDHYLGKETVQNLSVLRFANTVFESLWKRDRIRSVHVTVSESIGIEQRADYYESSGAFRDMIQNHLTQLVTLLAMEPPARFDAESIRNEKVKVLQSIKAIEPEDVVLGQYAAGEMNGERVPGYLSEEGVAQDSTTPTFVNLKLAIDNWRWKGVPFFLRTGKRLPRRMTRIVIEFHRPPISIFGTHNPVETNPNRLIIALQPDEGFHLLFEVKELGDEMRLRTEGLHFHYHDTFESLPDAYQTLIADVIQGDQTLFVRADEVEASWALYDPITGGDLPIHPYPAGSWGPPASDELLAKEGTAWMNDYDPD